MKSNLLVHYRKKAGLTQQQVGDSIGISAQAVSKWENDQSEPDLDTVCKLAKLYNVSVNDLLGFETEEAKPAEERKKPSAFSSFMSKALSFLKKNLRLIIIIAVACVLIAATVITSVVIYRSREGIRLAKKFEKVDIDMTMAEIEDIFGEPEEAVEIVYDENSESFGHQLAAELDREKYGYINCDFWYYRSAEYYKNVELKSTSSDDNLEFEPYVQVRIAFDKKTGKVIEAYCNQNADFTIIKDYKGKKNDVKSLTLPDNDSGKVFFDENTKIVFDDDSMYIGTTRLDKNIKGYDIRCPYGEFFVAKDKISGIKSLIDSVSLEKLFEKIKIGDSEATVLKLLDFVNETETAEDETLEYWYWKKDSTEIRLVYNTKSDTVTEAYYNAKKDTSDSPYGKKDAIVKYEDRESSYVKTGDRPVKLIFDDGSIFIGEAHITKTVRDLVVSCPQGEFSVVHHADPNVTNNNTEALAMKNKFLLLDLGTSLSKVKEIMGKDYSIEKSGDNEIWRWTTAGIEIRLVCSVKNDSLLEAYYNSIKENNSEYGAKYSIDSVKVMGSDVKIQGTRFVKITYNDGSIYLGEAIVTEAAIGRSVRCPVGSFTVTLEYIEFEE